jgi:adenylate cyclase class 2
MKNREIEIQVKIENDKKFKEFLKKNANFLKKIYQLDEYFSPPNQDFIEERPIKKWLRIRKSSDCSFITFKKYYYDENGKSTHCDEYETKIEDADKFKKILTSLNYKSLVVVNKKRKVWNFQNYQILIDSVKGLGNFVEIEFCGKEKTEPKKVINQMISFLKSIECGAIKRNYVGYPFQLLFPKEVKFEKI